MGRDEFGGALAQLQQLCCRRCCSCGAVAAAVAAVALLQQLLQLWPVVAAVAVWRCCSSSVAGAVAAVATVSAGTSLEDDNNICSFVPVKQVFWYQDSKLLGCIPTLLPTVLVLLYMCRAISHQTQLIVTSLSKQRKARK